MPRDDAGEGREGGAWDFDLPDLGASTTPDHHRRRGARPADEQAPERTGASAWRASPSEDDLLPAWASQRGASARRPRADQDDGPWDDQDHDDRAWHDQDGDDEGWDDQERDDEAWDDRDGDDEGPRDGRRPRRQGLAIRREGVIRALVVLAVLMLIVVLAVVAFGGGTRDAEQDDPAVVTEPSEEDPFAGFTPRPSQEAADGASGPAARACDDELSIRSSTDESSYGPDEDPVLIMTLENTGEQPCAVNAGTARMDFTVSSGSDTVFDSQHCQVEGQDRPIELDPGETESARMLWDRNRSGPGCPADTEEVPPGDYEFRAALGEVSGDPAEFTLQ